MCSVSKGSLTLQVTASGRFQRAIQAGNLFQGELAAREMGALPLGYALALCRLLGEAGDGRYERAVVRWHGRFVVERGVTRISESQLLLAALRRAALRRRRDRGGDLRS
jgi:hypothetical protein